MDWAPKKHGIERTDIWAGTVADKYDYYFFNFIKIIAPLSTYSNKYWVGVVPESPSLPINALLLCLLFVVCSYA